MAARTGVGKLTLIDPEVLAPENLGRHVLTSTSLGKPKVAALAEHLRAVNPEIDIVSVQGRFQGEFPVKPDLIVSAVDSFSCESHVNTYALDEGVKTVFVGVWGEARVAEIYYVIPGQTACYECFASFRRQTLDVPTDPRKYTDPDFDETKVAGQPGLWANILLASSLAFQVCLGLCGVRSEIIDPERNLLLFNISSYDSPLQPLALTFARPQKGCAICDESKLEELTV